MKLNEQIHKNLYRPYYRGQRLDYDESKSNFKDKKFYTTNLFYAYFKAIEEKGNIIEYRLKNEVNIFNIKSKNDKLILHGDLMKLGLDFACGTLLNNSSDTDWTYISNGDENRDIIIDIVKNLGYDGFFNYEYTNDFKRYIRQNRLHIEYPMTDKNPAICVFNKDIFTKIGEYSIEDIKYSDDLNKFKKAEENFIRNFFDYLKDKDDRETSYNMILDDIKKQKFLLLSNDEALSILNDCYSEWTPQKIKEANIKHLEWILNSKRFKISEIDRKNLFERLSDLKNN